MELTNEDIKAYESLSLDDLIEERTRLAKEVNDMSLSAEERNYRMDLMEVVCDLIWERMYG